MTQESKRLSVAVPVPVADRFDYAWNDTEPPPRPGVRVLVPFGRQQRIGVVVDRQGESDIPAAALKPVAAVLDPEPLLDGELMRSLEWASAYYHHPLGEVLVQALPGLLRRGRPARRPVPIVYELTPAGRSEDARQRVARAPRQAEVLAALIAGARSAAELRERGCTADAIRRAEQRGWIAPRQQDSQERAEAKGSAASPEHATETPPELTDDQRAAVDAARAVRGFATILLYGVTGSGKTEVFLRMIDEALRRDRQCLLLVPEIGLTPQLVRRLEARFGCELAVFHSGLTDAERLDAWRRTRAHEAKLIIGTRSAVFAPLRHAGLIVVDEEHDPSFKQQTGFRYSARDLAIVRARALDVPIVLASATPSLESLRNAREGRYRLLALPRRIGAGGNPVLRVIDLNQHAERKGLSTPLLAAMDAHLNRGHQVLLFINRRGFAPALFCPTCQVAVECRRCDARMTIHAKAGQLRCHHCGRQEPLRWVCPACGSERIGVGAGTERVTTELESLYPELGIARLDRDAVRGRDALGKMLEHIETGNARIIVGTQLLTKGHDFRDVTLVGVLNADQGLFGTDFRSEERLAQTVVQVAGRAGRRDRTGEVLIQTHYPRHPLLQRLLAHDYAAFAEHALAERQQSGWPPYSHLAVWRAEATQRDPVFAFLNRLRREIGREVAGLEVLGPTPDWMERRDGRYRGQLLLQSAERAPLHDLIERCLAALRGWKESRRVRWAIDVDPVEL